MSSKMSKILVIDASVARSAGETEHPISKSCRETLSAVLKICHKVVMCKEIDDEWNKHKSRFSSAWLAAMQSRGKVIRVEIPKDSDLSEKLEELNIETSGIKAMLKDAHLVEAALLTDLRIITNDEAARKLFCANVEEIPRLKPICWVNPTIEQDHCLQWLKAGAKY